MYATIVQQNLNKTIKQTRRIYTLKFKLFRQYKNVKVQKLIFLV